MVKESGMIIHPWIWYGGNPSWQFVFNFLSLSQNSNWTDTVLLSVDKFLYQRSVYFLRDTAGSLSFHGSENIACNWENVIQIINLMISLAQVAEWPWRHQQAIIDVNSIVSGRNYDILTSIITKLITSRPFKNLSHLAQVNFVYQLKTYIGLKCFIS